MSEPTLDELRFRLDLFNLARGLDRDLEKENAEANSLEGLLEACSKGAG